MARPGEEETDHPHRTSVERAGSGDDAAHVAEGAGPSGGGARHRSGCGPAHCGGAARDRGGLTMVLVLIDHDRGQLEGTSLEALTLGRRLTSELRRPLGA